MNQIDREVLYVCALALVLEVHSQFPRTGLAAFANRDGLSAACKNML